MDASAFVCDRTISVVRRKILSRGKGIMTSVPAWCVSAHASFVFKIDSQKTQCLLIALKQDAAFKKDNTLCRGHILRCLK